MSVLLVPATRKNLEKSIERRVDYDFAKEYLPESFLHDIIQQSGNEGIRCWAVTKNKRSLYESIRNGDEVLLTEKGTGLFTHYGIVVGKIQNESFGKALWPISGINPWEYIYFLASIQRIQIAKKTLVAQLGYNESFAVAGSIIAKRGNLGMEESIAKQYCIPVPEYIAENNEDVDYSASNFESSSTRRQGHARFSRNIKQNYSYRCAICGICEPEFLVAGHISAWAEDERNRLNPSNGLCLCSLHDKAFEHGYISIDNDYKVIVNGDIRRGSVLRNELERFEGMRIALPAECPPNLGLLRDHREKHGI